MSIHGEILKLLWKETLMSDRMTPISFPKLMKWILDEKKTRGTVFGVHRPYFADADHVWEIFGNKLEMPFGPAAGPHTQLSQNIIAAYYAGSRFFELKTVQKLDGDDLPVSKPCILADDEGYNCEWSTELYVPEAFDEYVKAWVAIKVIAREFGLGAMDGFQFNMSVGYDLEGIKTAKIDKFIEDLKDAGETPVYKECIAWLTENIGLFNTFSAKDISSISPAVCNSVTLSTLHGCPPQEIERISMYLLTEKKIHTFIKCNPTLLGYEYARKTLDDMGYDYLVFGDNHFRDDLQYSDAIPMIKRLQEAARSAHLEFGVKITNTFPVDVAKGELPSQEMYMSGKALYPLSMSVAAKLAADFNGDIRISFSGGADAFNIERIIDAGIWPVTMATTLLKSGGYQRLEQIAGRFGRMKPKTFTGVNAKATAVLADTGKRDRHHMKAIKPLPSRKNDKKVPLTDCFFSPCQEGCPIGQDITEYLKLVKEGKNKDALAVIIDKNPLPFITGTICAHNCMSKCTRNFYETPVNIRSAKLEAAAGGFEGLIKELTRPEVTSDRTAAVIGGGPAGMAAAFFLARGGMKTTLFERNEKLGGVVRSVIPDFRISDSAIDNDVKLIEAMGVTVITGKEITTITGLKKDFDFIVMAVGATSPGVLDLQQGESRNAIEFLENFKKTNGHMDLGKRVVVIGGGNTAMDTARAAKRTDGVTQVAIVYRRTKRYMPADEEELLMAQEEGIDFVNLLAPVSSSDGRMVCSKMQLGEPDASGRRSVVDTGEEVCVACDTIISAVGEKVPTQFYKDNNLETDKRGYLVVDPVTLETSMKGVYAVGDGLGGPATVVEGIRDAAKAAEGILLKKIMQIYISTADPESIYDKKGKLAEEDEAQSDSNRCLSCNTVCENCVEVCPNRANVSVHVPGFEKSQIIHVDYMCNECGNCRSFCPYDSAPYLDKFTLFANVSDMNNSKNQGFTVIDRESGICRVRLDGKLADYTSGTNISNVPEDIGMLIDAVMEGYSHLL